MTYDPTKGRGYEQVVYFIDCGGVTKIGIAKNALKRLKALTTSHHEELRLWATMPGGRKTEAKLHAKFSEMRIRGEWFSLTAEARVAIVAAINRKGGHIFDIPLTSRRTKPAPVETSPKEIKPRYAWVIPRALCEAHEIMLSPSGRKPDWPPKVVGLYDLLPTDTYRGPIGVQINATSGDAPHSMWTVR